MALIRRFTERRSTRVGWRSEVECGYTIGEFDGTPVVHLETYGSSARAIPGKVSQSLEIDQERARELVLILRKAFPRLEA